MKITRLPMTDTPPLRWYYHHPWSLALSMLGAFPLLLWASPLWAQHGSPPRRTATAGVSGIQNLDSATRAHLTPILARAKDRGLPVEALTTKAAEGVLRGVPSARIVAAVEALEERLTTAHVALAPAQPEELEAGALALAVGVNVNVLRTIRQYQPHTSVAVPLGVLAQLLAQKGISQQRAIEIVYQLLKRGATPQQFLALRTDVHRDIAAGTVPSRALDTRAADVLTALGRVPAMAGGSGGVNSPGAPSRR